MISVALMEDCRVSLALSYINSLGAADVFSTVPDGWVTGVGNCVRSVFDDTFSGVLNGDFVSGGNRTDTVALTCRAALGINPATSPNFPATTPVLSSIENLTGNDGKDDLRGNRISPILLDAGKRFSFRASGDDTLAQKPMTFCSLCPKTRLWTAEPEWTGW